MKMTMGLLKDRGSLALAGWVGAVAVAVAVAGWVTTPAHAIPELVARPGILPKGEGSISFGAGTYLREISGNLTAGVIDLRFGWTDRLEVRVLLPGVTVEIVRETKNWPGLIGFIGISEVGFSSIHGAVVGYQTGVRLSQRVLPRLRMSLNIELRHRLLGQENAELFIIGPLPPSRAGLFAGDIVVQLHTLIALTGGLGYAVSIGEGRSFGYGALGIVGSLANRLDLFTQVLFERSRPDRIFTPAFFGGLTLSF